MRKLLPLLLISCLLLLGCTPVEQNARDGIATAAAVLRFAQTKYGPSCTANPKQAICQNINKAVHANNLAIDALESYCQLTPASDPTLPCKPVKALEPALASALANLNQTVTDLKGALQ